jgi:hypothetical protein
MKARSDALRAKTAALLASVLSVALSGCAHWHRDGACQYHDHVAPHPGLCSLVGATCVGECLSEHLPCVFHRELVEVERPPAAYYPTMWHRWPMDHWPYGESFPPMMAEPVPAPLGPGQGPLELPHPAAAPPGSGPMAPMHIPAPQPPSQDPRIRDQQGAAAPLPGINRGGYDVAASLAKLPAPHRNESGPASERNDASAVHRQLMFLGPPLPPGEVPTVRRTPPTYEAADRETAAIHGGGVPAPPRQITGR